MFYVEKYHAVAELLGTSGCDYFLNSDKLFSKYKLAAIKEHPGSERQKRRTAAKQYIRN